MRKVPATHRAEKMDPAEPRPVVSAECETPAPDVSSLASPPHAVPTRKLSPFFQFMKENRSRVQKELSDAGQGSSPRDVSKQLGVMWRERKLGQNP